MNILRLSQGTGSALTMEPTESHQVLVMIREWTGNGINIAQVRLDIREMYKLACFCDKFVQDNKEQLSLLLNHAMKQNIALQRIYTSSELSGSFSYEQILELKDMGISISHLLAKDLNVSVHELYKIIKLAPLPFALFKKHFEHCKEQIKSTKTNQ